jgi:hypothetical protein
MVQVSKETLAGMVILSLCGMYTTHVVSSMAIRIGLLESTVEIATTKLSLHDSDIKTLSQLQSEMSVQAADSRLHEAGLNGETPLAHIAATKVPTAATSPAAAVAAAVVAKAEANAESKSARPASEAAGGAKLAVKMETAAETKARADPLAVRMAANFGVTASNRFEDCADLQTLRTLTYDTKLSPAFDTMKRVLETEHGTCNTFSGTFCREFAAGKTKGLCLIQSGYTNADLMWVDEDSSL